MAIEIMQGHGDTQYITFGDEDRMYELLGTPNSAEPGKYDFELRVDNDPNSTFVEFSLTDQENASMKDTFAAALEQAQVEMAASEEDYVGRSQLPEEARKGIEHLQGQLKDAASDLEAEDFTEAVSSMPEQDGPEL